MSLIQIEKNINEILKSLQEQKKIIGGDKTDSILNKQEKTDSILNKKIQEKTDSLINNNIKIPNKHNETLLSELLKQSITTTTLTTQTTSENKKKKNNKSVRFQY